MLCMKIRGHIFKKVPFVNIDLLTVQYKPQAVWDGNLLQLKLAIPYLNKSLL